MYIFYIFPLMLIMYDQREYILEKLNIDYEHIVIDNSSTDKTIDILKEICLNDKKVKAIIETSKSLEPLLHPAKYKSMFAKINTISWQVIDETKPNYAK